MHLFPQKEEVQNSIVVQLWDLLEQREAYVQELLAIIEKSKMENSKEIESLKNKNAELNGALRRIQMFMENEEKQQK